MRLFTIIFLFLVTSCQTKEKAEVLPDVFVVVLGIAQDAGSPQINCQKSCCKDLWDKPEKRQKVVSLGLVDRIENKVWLFDATPDFKDQLQQLLSYLPEANINSLGGIFLTHAHIGHYTGLMDLGREALGANNVPVYAMPKMKSFLETNGPWSQLVDLNNINLFALNADSTINLTDDLRLTPMLVPHRDEYSETVGYRVQGVSKSFLFIPDIDKWNKWDRDIKEEVENSDYAFLDGAFYSEEELPNRNMSEIPHPFIPETMAIFKDSDLQIREKVIFIHLNHTNPLLRDNKEFLNVTTAGYKVGREEMIFLFR